MKPTFLTTAALLAMLSLCLAASPLDEAKISRVVNEATIAPRSGTPRRVVMAQAVRPDENLRSGPRSRAELSFPDGTLARIGAETTVTLPRGSRELALEQGTLLLEVPSLRGGARVRLGSLTAVCGAATVLIEHLPSRSLKIVVLTGDLRIATGGFFGDSLVLEPGKMLITTAEVKRIPDPVDVDLATLVKTSALIDAGKFSAGAAPLASLPRIEREIARQAGGLTKQRLIATNLAIVGSGTSVVIPSQPAAEVAKRGESNVGPTARENQRESLISAEMAAHRSAENDLDGEILPSKP